MSSATRAFLNMPHLRDIGIASWRSPLWEGASAAAAEMDSASAAGGAEASASSAAPAKAADAAASAPPAAANEATASFVEKSAEELAKMSKEERTAYYAAKRAATQQGPKKQLSKAERRQIQEAQRAVKNNKQAEAFDSKEMLEELKMQGLSEEQAKEMLDQLASTKEEVADEDDDEAEDLLGSVRRWMSEQASTVQDHDPKDVLQDFNMSVRFQGHVDSTPPDHICAIVKVMSEQAIGGIATVVGSKLQPTTVCKEVDGLVTKWSGLLEQLAGKIDDVLAAADSVVGTVHEAVQAECAQIADANPDCVEVGILMAIRESTEVLSDDDLLTGCRRLDARSKVMEKFIDFLEEAAAEDDDEDGDDD